MRHPTQSSSWWKPGVNGQRAYFIMKFVGVYDLCPQGGYSQIIWNRCQEPIIMEAVAVSVLHNTEKERNQTEIRNQECFVIDKSDLWYKLGFLGNDGFLLFILCTFLLLFSFHFLPFFECRLSVDQNSAYSYILICLHLPTS